MSVIKMLILLSILILVHEAGHFLVAKMFKMKVSKFGFGLPIGPTLWEKQVGDVKVLIHAFLLGGYVAFPDDDKELDLPPDSPDRFLNRPVYQRFFVVSAGVVANVICAFALVFLTAALWGQLPSGKYNVYVEELLPDMNKSVTESGLMKGDRIVSINNSDISSSYGIVTYAKLSKQDDGKVDSFFYENNFDNLKRLNPAYKKDELIPDDVTIQLPYVSAENSVQLSKSEARGYSIHKDVQISLSDKQKTLRDELKGKKYYISDGSVTLDDIAMAISDGKKPLNITVERNGKSLVLDPLYPNNDGIIGIKFSSQEIFTSTKSLKSVVVSGYNYLYDQTYMLLYGLGQIFTGKIPLKDLHGVIAIVKVGGDIIQNSGIFYGLLLTAVISMDLAIVNFLPIPALDGGHVMFLLIEKLRGKPVDNEMADKIGTAGFLFLCALMVVVIFNDIFALVTKQF